MAAGLVGVRRDLFFCRRIFGILPLRHDNVSTTRKGRVREEQTYDDVEASSRHRSEY